MTDPDDRHEPHHDHEDHHDPEAALKRPDELKGHVHVHDDRSARTLVLEQAVLAKNDVLADANRSWFAEQRILAVNLMSSPGAGKTTLLERTITDLSAELPMAVVEGDQETLLDADRIRATGCSSLDCRGGTPSQGRQAGRGLGALNLQANKSVSPRPSRHRLKP